MNKLLYILLLSFFTLSAIGVNKNTEDNCGKRFTLKREQRYRKVVDQNRKAKVSPPKDSAASKEMDAKVKYKQELKRLLMAGKYKEGMELINQLIKEGEDTQFILGWKATFWLRAILTREEIEKILAFLNKSIEKYPTDIDLHSRRGHVHFLLRDNKQSLSDNKFAIEGGSKHLGGLLEAAQSAIFLMDSNDKSDINSDQSEPFVETAIRYSRRFLSEAEPDSRNVSQAYFVLARALHIKEKYQESIENYDLAIENLSSKSTIKTISNLYHSRARAISDLADRTSDRSLAINHYKEAIADCERAIGVLGKRHPYLNAIFALKKSITPKMRK